MKTSDFLRHNDACSHGAKWALSVSPDMAAVWDALIEQGKHSWLLWTATRPGVFPDSTLRKLACRFVRETPLMDGRKVWDLMEDDRSRKAVEVAERFATGNATDEELELARAAARAAADAANAAADAAADAAAGAAARAAARAARAACAARAAYAAVGAARAARAANAAVDAAYAAQVPMIAELGNPFRKEKDNG